MPLNVPSSQTFLVLQGNQTVTNALVATPVDIASASIFERSNTIIETDLANGQITFPAGIWVMHAIVRTNAAALPAPTAAGNDAFYQARINTVNSAAGKSPYIDTAYQAAGTFAVPPVAGFAVNVYTANTLTIFDLVNNGTTPNANIFYSFYANKVD